MKRIPAAQDFQCRIYFSLQLLAFRFQSLGKGSSRAFG